MTQEELKIRQITNQHLISSCDTVTAARSLCGIQAQFMSNALHSLKIRCNDYSESTIGTELIKNWTIRGTVHVFAKEDIPLHLCSSNAGIYRSQDWTIPTFWNQRSDWALTPKRQAKLSDCILAALQEHTRTREELKFICREYGMTESEEASMFHPWGGGIRELCERGFIHGLAQKEKAYCLSPVFKPIKEQDAALELARRYFTNIAPATIHDAMYFFKTNAKQVKLWLDQLPITSTQYQGKNYYYIEQDRNYHDTVPACLFLAGFDQLVLGYEKKESLYLSAEHMRRIFNLAGIVMPAVLLKGQIIGRWKKKNHKLTVELFEPIEKNDRQTILDAAETLWQSSVSDIAFNFN